MGCGSTNAISPEFNPFDFMAVIVSLPSDVDKTEINRGLEHIGLKNLDSRMSIHINSTTTPLQLCVLSFLTRGDRDSVVDREVRVKNKPYKIIKAEIVEMVSRYEVDNDFEAMLKHMDKLKKMKENFEIRVNFLNQEITEMKKTAINLDRAGDKQKALGIVKIFGSKEKQITKLNDYVTKLSLFIMKLEELSDDMKMFDALCGTEALVATKLKQIENANVEDVMESLRLSLENAQKEGEALQMMSSGGVDSEEAQRILDELVRNDDVLQASVERVDRGSNLQTSARQPNTDDVLMIE